MDHNTLQTNDWQLIGHTWAVEMLQQHLRSDQARHAYLISGPTGIGRRTLALQFIQAMNCPNKKDPGCGCMQLTCRTCRQIMEMQHPDLKILRVPAGKSEILIDQVRELQSFLMLAPYEASYKVGLLLNFERATVQAQNALLKTLEEAPPRARILITVDSPDGLLPTILSRCEPLRLRPLPLGSIADSLQHSGADAERIRLIDHLSAGRYGFAMQLLEEPDQLDDRAETIRSLTACIPSSLRKRFHLAEELLPRKADLSSQRQKARLALQVWQSAFRDAILFKADQEERMMNQDLQSEMKRISAAFSVHQLQQLIENCDLAIERIDRYCNIRLVLESFLEELG